MKFAGQLTCISLSCEKFVTVFVSVLTTLRNLISFVAKLVQNFTVLHLKVLLSYILKVTPSGMFPSAFLKTLTLLTRNENKLPVVDIVSIDFSRKQR